MTATDREGPGSVEVVRGSLVESRHAVTVAVVDADGQLVHRVGDPDRLITYMRSAAKPLQALAAVEAGVLEAYGLDERALAMMCASHSGTPLHTQIVADMLERIGLGPQYLQCGAHWPYHGPTADAMRRRGEEPTALHSNCSGKHAGMLAFSRHLGADVATYRRPEHPVQRRIRALVSALTGTPEEALVLAVDGCGVPVFGLSVTAMATAFARLGAGRALDDRRAAAARRIAGAMRAEPELVAGPGRFDTILMESLRGRVVAKTGAEGVQCLALPERGLGVALKVHDGSARAAAPATLETLDLLGVLAEPERQALGSLRQPVVRNVAGDAVGEIRCQLSLRKVGSRAG